MKDEIKEKFKEKHKKEIEEINNQFEELIKDDEIKEISQNSDFFHHFLHIFPEKAQLKNDLLDYITTLQKENKQLKKRNKEIYDGYMASTQELTEYAEENERLNNIIKEIRELADKYEMGKYDYNVPSFEIKEILDKENKQ